MPIDTAGPTGATTTVLRYAPQGNGWRRRAEVHGVAASLLLLVAAQVAVDHYSEQRVRAYAQALAVVQPQ